MGTPAAEALAQASSPITSKGGESTENEEAMLKVIQKTDAVNKINCTEYNTKSNK